MDPVVEGNYGKNSKEGQQEFCVYRVWRDLIIVYIFIFMRVKKINASMAQFPALSKIIKKLIIIFYDAVNKL